MGSVLESFSDLIDFIESAGYSKYLIGDKVSSGPPPPPIPCDCTKFGFCFAVFVCSTLQMPPAKRRGPRLEQRTW